MSATKSGSPANATEEITALIEVLHTTGQRLEELTGGEVDAVADSAGRTFLLRRAQDRLRFSKAARQTAILNALPANVALLDTEGVITSVNEAWQRFASANMLQGPADAIGLNYLGICEDARGEGSSEAADVAAGIRAVLDGSARRFSIEYPCHSPAEQRWFLLTVTPLSNERLTGAVVMHLDVTQQRQLAQELEIERSRLVAAQRVAKVGSWETDLITLSVIWSRETHRIHETNPATFRPSHQTFLNQVHPEDRERVGEAFIRSLDQHAACAIEHRLLLPDGRIKFVEERWQVLFDQHDKAFRAIGTCQDVTEKARANAHIRRLNRVYAVLSGINSLIVRVRGRDELFREACRIAVEAGGFRMALICTVDRNSMKIVPVASAGKGVDLLAAIKRALASSDDAPKTMVALAVRDKKPVLSNDSQNDSRLIFGRQYSESGVRSLAVLPLLVAGEAVGVLALYSGESGFFVEEELTLLTELSGDIAFAIDHIGQQERLDYLTYYDVLTGLATRTLFLERVAKTIVRGGGSDQNVAIFLLDVERFRAVNDALGRKNGDELLKQIADRLRKATGDDSYLAYLGADHFAFFESKEQNEQQIARLCARRLKELFGPPFRIGGSEIRFSAKLGIAMFPGDGVDSETLFKNAEAALKRAKLSGAQYVFYAEEMTARVAENLSLENKLRQALEKEEFVLHYQPKMSFATGKLTGAEALIRWNDPLTGLVSPGQFIPILEETGLIYEVGRWALRKAIEDFLRWHSAGLAVARIAVNVSPLQLRSRGLVDEIRQAVSVSPHAAAGLELEITESVIMEDVDRSIADLQAIRDMGMTIAIDDFGTGFSSLSYLSKLPVDTLKIDRSFINDMTATQEGLALVSTIINLAHSLKLKVVAEGVETEDQSRLLRLLNCDEMQGYLFSKPVPAAIFETRFLVLPAAA